MARDRTVHQEQQAAQPTTPHLPPKDSFQQEPNTVYNARTRRFNRETENRSLRRGALQSLAQLEDMSDEILLSFSGHTNLCTLRRYLNWGSVDRAKEVAMTKAASAESECPGTSF
jgi:hypothetical protein